MKGKRLCFFCLRHNANYREFNANFRKLLFEHGLSGLNEHTSKQVKIYENSRVISSHIFLNVRGVQASRARSPANLRLKIKQNKQTMKESKSTWEVILRIIVAAISAALTALGTTSCIRIFPALGY